jgi:type II secretory pathway pseudopilin PulG
MLMTAWIRRRLADRAVDDGFTLVELVVAMFITLLVMSSLLGIVVQGLSSVAKSKQRQEATAQANGAMEKLRAVPYASLTSPVGPQSVAAGDPNLDYTSTPPRLLLSTAAGCPATPSSCEQLIVNSFSPAKVTSVVDGVTYTVTTYVSIPNVTTSGAQPFSLTAFVSYKSNVSGGPQTSVQHSTTFSPNGCLSIMTHPFSGPCQTYFTIQAGLSDTGVSVTKAHANPSAASPDPLHPNAINGINLGDGVGEIDLGMPTLSTNLLIEQTVSGKGTVATTDGRQISDSGSLLASTGGTTANASVDTDPSTTTQPSSTPPAVAQNYTPLTTTGAGGSLTVTPISAGTGQISAGTAADSTLCIGGDAAGSPLSTGVSPTPGYRPCVSGKVQPGGIAGTIAYQAMSSSGPILAGGAFQAATFNAAQLDPWSTAARAVSAHLTTANSSACTTSPGASGTGCGEAHASRTIDHAYFGGVPSVSTASPAVAGTAFSTSWSVSNLVEDAYAESGTGARTPAVYTRTGQLTYWCPTLCGLAAGVNYKTVTLTGTPGLTKTYAAEKYTSTYTQPNGTMTFIVQSTITVTQPTLVASVPDAACKTAACTYAATDAQGILGQTTYTVNFTDNSGTTTELTSFVVVANLGGLIAQSSMKVAM